jgi:hypothetical protein
MEEALRLAGGGWAPSSGHEGPRGILYAYKPQDAFKPVTRKGIGWCGCQARVTCTTGEALFYFQSLLGPCG